MFGGQYLLDIMLCSSHSFDRLTEHVDAALQVWQFDNYKSLLRIGSKYALLYVFG